MQREAVDLYRGGLRLRDVAEKVGKSHEWVRRTLLRAGEDSRIRGRAPRPRPRCLVCASECPKPDGQFCSRECTSKSRRQEAVDRLKPALRALKKGATFAAAAEEIGFQNGWHLYGRLQHFGLLPEGS